ncbi:MAG: amidohydrolase family protein [bacterium]|nr:amidohydrolase family protein [bacterium]
MSDRYMEAAWQGRPIDFHFVMDSHAHLGQNEPFIIIDSSAESMLTCKDRMGIDLTAVSSLPGTIGGWTRGNDQVIEAVQNYPDRFFGYITINAHDPGGVLKECERCWDGGCRALKLHTGQGPDYDHPAIEPALEFANEKGCPVLCHVWGRELDHMEPLMNRYSNSTWILAHAGCAEKEKYARVARAHDNAVIETCYSRCPKGLIEYFVDEGLEDKTLWGSDANFYASTHQFGRVLFAEVSETIKKKLLCDNARRVFQLG